MADYKPPKPPPGCKSIADWEHTLSELTDALLERGRKLIEREGRIDVATGKELILAATRTAKLAAECAARRENDAHDNWSARQVHEMQNGGLGPRPALRRKP